MESDRPLPGAKQLLHRPIAERGERRLLAGVRLNCSRVRQELIQAENDGTRFVTDDVARIYQMQAAQRTQQSADGYGADMGGSSASGKATGSQTHATPASCLG